MYYKPSATQRELTKCNYRDIKYCKCSIHTSIDRVIMYYKPSATRHATREWELQAIEKENCQIAYMEYIDTLGKIERNTHTQRERERERDRDREREISLRRQ